MASIWYLHDNHASRRLDMLPIERAIELMEQATEYDGGYGFIGCKGFNDGATLQTRPDDDPEIARQTLREWFALLPNKEEGGMGTYDCCPGFYIKGN